MTYRFVVGALALGVAGAIGLSAEAQTLRWASQGDALTFDPHGQNEGPTNTANQQVYEPLITRDPEMQKEPALATEWGITDDPTVWEFKLREGVTFHEGQAFTAEDVVFSLNRAKGETSDFKNYITSVMEVTAVDDHTVHVKTDGPNPILPDQLTTLFMMDKGWAEEHDVTEPQDYAGGEETYAVRNANGTGPFRLEIREPDVRTVMVRNDDWWGGEVALEKIIYTPIANDATRVAALLSGEIDYLLDPPLQDLERIKNTPGLKTEQVNQIRTIFLGMDQGVDELRTSDVEGENPFQDARVREAMYRAIDIEAIHDKVMRGLSIPAGMITSPGVHGYTEELDERLAYDPDRAKELLAEAGYADGFSVGLDCPNNRYNNDEAICQAVVGMLGKIGLDVNLDAQPKSLHFPKLQNRETDFYMLGWGVPTLDSHYVFTYLFHKDGPWNATGYDNARVNELTEAMETEIDLAKRDQMIQEAWEIANGDIVYLPLHHQVIAWAMTDSFDMPIVPNDSPQFRWAKFTE